MEITPYTRMVFYHETDRMDIVNHSNYIHMAEEARVDFKMCIRDRSGTVCLRCTAHRRFAGKRCPVYAPVYESP